MARKMIVKPGEVKSVELNASFTNVNENGTEPDPWDIPRDGGENEAPPPAPVQAEPPRRIRRVSTPAPEVESEPKLFAATAVEKQIENLRGPTVVNNLVVQPAEKRELAVGVAVDLIATEPTKIVVTYGKELFSPKQYHTIDVGPFSIEVTVPAGESVTKAFDTNYAVLKQIAEKDRVEKVRSFVDAVRAVHK